MEIKFIKIDDREDWDTKLIALEGRFLQSFEQGEVYKADGCDVERYYVFDGDRFLAAMQVVVYNARRGKFALVPYGPVFARDITFEYKKSVLVEIKKLAEDHFKSLGCVSFRISFDAGGDNFLLTDEAKKIGFYEAPMHMVSEHSLLVDLTKYEDDLLAELRKGTRYDIKQCDKYEMEYKEESDENGLNILLDLLEKTSVRQGFTTYSKKFIRAQYDQFIKNSDNSKISAKIFVAYYNKQAVSVFFIIIYGNEASYYHAASERVDKVPAATGLMWFVIKQLKMLGITRFNLWGVVGTEDRKHPWFGLSTFKRGFGDIELKFPHLLELKLSWKANLLYLVDRYRKWKRGY